jgi:adenylate cyclase
MPSKLGSSLRICTYQLYWILGDIFLHSQLATSANRAPAVSNIRLRPSIVLLFVVLVVPIFTAMLWFTYTTNDKMTRTNATALMERFRFEATTNTQNLLKPLETMVSTAATLASGQPVYFRDAASAQYLKDIIAHSETVSSAYVGFNDGTFRMVMRTPAGLKIHDKVVPSESDHAYRWLDRSVPANPVDTFSFRDQQDKEVGVSQVAAVYDPRLRDWYKDAAIKKSTALSTPYIFSSSGLPGITIASPFYKDGALTGVVAVDITLNNLSQFLAARLVSPGAMSLIIDEQEKVIANSNLKEQVKLINNKVNLKHIGALDSDLPALAMVQQAKASDKNNFTFVHPTTAEEYAVSFSSFASDANKRWQVLILAPLDDFSGPLKENNRRLLVFGTLAIILQILFIYFLSRLIAKPLERLERKVNNVRELSTDSQNEVITSPIREISSLSRAVDTLDHAVRSFAAFVPVSLVKHLIESERQLQLGGESRFLTVMFCDVEAFSTLAESSPSNELLTRISAYLEVVTLAVNEEHGTIDKFIGDAAMAFWGAPAPLNDHAWHACAAAIRISKRMATLNAQWVAEGLAPLQIRIGIHCDAMMVGNIGSKHRMSYTVMGDAVNLTSRLEEINKEYGTQICVSQSIYREIGERLTLRPIDEVTVKGRRTALNIYELFGVIDNNDPSRALETSEEVIEQCHLTNIARQAYVDKNWKKAASLYEELFNRFPKDHLATNMLMRCQIALKNQL